MKRKPRRTKEEIEIERIAKEKRKEERILKKKAKEEEKRKKAELRANPPTEEELVNKYVKRVIDNQRNHGRVDKDKFGNISYDKKVNKNLWLDTDFYFSVVFQSSEQKYEFLAKLGMIEEEIQEALDSNGVKIVNGLTLAKKLDIELDLEKRGDYPLPNLDLFPYILDTETLEVPES